MDSSIFGYSPEDFKEEAKELLSRAEDILERLKAAPSDADGVNALFRAIHSLKGSAAYVGLSGVNAFSHLYESFLGDVRSKKYGVDGAVLSILVRARDYLEDLIFHPDSAEAAKIDDSIADNLKKISAALSSRGQNQTPTAHSPAAANPPLAAKETAPKAVKPPESPKKAAQKQKEKDDQATEIIRITIIQSLKNLANALTKDRPDKKELQKILGKLEETVLWAFGEDLNDVVLPLEEMKGLVTASLALGQKEISTLRQGYNIVNAALKKELALIEGTYSPAHGKEAAEKEARQEEKDSTENGKIKGASRDEIVRITVIKNIDSLKSLLNDEPIDPVFVRRVLMKLADLNRWTFGENEEISSNIIAIEGLLPHCGEKEALRELKIRGTVLQSIFLPLAEVVEKKPALPGPVAPEPYTDAFDNASEPARANDTRRPRSLGVSKAAAVAATLKIKRDDLESLITTVSGLRGLEGKDFERLQATTLELRMVPVGELFSRFRKIVRDLSEELGKPITLDIAGESVKLDKVIADKLNEPLLHMIRNAASHGIESPQERAAKRKGPALIRLNAYQEGGQIIIEVSDNGRGISLEKVKKRAVETGLIKEEELVKAVDKKILDFIFAPGFSTKEGVDKVSGRGVGLDVVKEVVTSLQGSISIDTTPGAGTTFRVQLPLTLAVIRAMVLEQTGNKIAVPAASVDRIMGMTERELEEACFMDKNRLCLYLPEEGEVIPIVNFSQLFELKINAEKRCVVLLKAGGGHKAALVVDAALGRHPLTVKPLDRFSETRYFSSASILEDEVVLILNIPSLIAA